MPLYIDRHKHIEGLTAEAVAEAHQRDLEVQARYGARALKYWFNEDKGEDREAHGLMADEIVEVEEGT
jgi:hypothetical protein